MSNEATPGEVIREVALRPFGHSSWRFWTLAGLLAVVVGWGVVGWIVQLRDGLDAAGYHDRGFWGIYEANLVAFIGVSYGGALVSAILRLTQAGWRAPITRLAEAMALFSLLVGMVYALIHLGRPERIWRMVVTPQTSSPLVWDFVAIMSYLAATLCFLYLPLIPDLALVRDRFKNGGGWRARLAGALAVNWQGLPEQRRLLNRAITTVAIIIIPLAVVVHSVLSWAFAVTTRPGWSSTIFGPYFVVAALYSGVAMVILVVAGFRAAYRLQDYIGLEHFRRLAFMMLALDLLYLYFTFTEMLTEGYARTEETAPVLEAVLIGRYAPFFWLFFIGAGVAPLLTIALPRTRTLPGIIIASSLVVVGMWLKRVLIIVPAVANPLIQGAWGNFNLTWVAVAVTLGGAAAIPLMLMMFFKCVPILAVDEIEEVAAETAESDHPMAQPQVALHAGGARK